jgi:hypothetical protein
MVTSHNMIEREMDNRGSKSVMSKNIAVKEQRVYGNYFGLVNPRLRCILRGLERDFQIKYYVLYLTTRVNVVMERVSNQINRSVSYSTLTTETLAQKINSNTNPAQTRKLGNMNPFFLRGLRMQKVHLLYILDPTINTHLNEKFSTVLQ